MYHHLTLLVFLAAWRWSEHVYGNSESAAPCSTPSSTQWTWRSSICRCGSTTATATSQNTWSNSKQSKPTRMPELKARSSSTKSQPFLTIIRFHWRSFSFINSYLLSMGLLLAWSLHMFTFGLLSQMSSHTSTSAEPDWDWNIQALYLRLLSCNT